MCEGHVPEAGNIPDLHDVGEGIVLEKALKPEPRMKSVYHVYVDGDLFGRIAAHPTESKFGLKDRSVQIVVENALLYTGEWYEYLDRVINRFGLVVNNVTRLDIAVDGLNYLVPFLNAYTKQTAENKVVSLKGRRPVQPWGARQAFYAVQLLQSG